MTSLLFVRKPHVYLPEIPAYRNYLAARFPGLAVHESTDLPQYNPADYDILWHFMGIDTAGRGRYVVHEYNSLSTLPLAKIKNIVKRTVNARPQRRVFLSERVKRDFGFDDGVPAHIRDMGIDARFFAAARTAQPEFDFIYAGGLNRGPVIPALLDRFAGALKNSRILLVGDAPEDMKARYKNNPDIVFHGRVPYAEIPALLGRARYGLNIMPDIYPFNVQTATKVLEYCAAGLPVVTTGYAWIDEFERVRGANFFRLAPDCGNLTTESLAAFDFKIPDVADLEWDRVIGDSGIFEFLE